MSTSTQAIILIFVLFGLLEFWRTGLFSKSEQTRDDGIVEAVSSIVLLTATQPAIILFTGWLGGQIAPQYAGALAGINVFAAIAAFIILDDMTQYWWHRASHTFPWLYNLHRAHHNARYMSVRLVYRNNIIYYAMMPGIWLSAALIYLGLGWVYAGYIVVKMFFITSAHSDMAWDKPLYKHAWASPVMWVVERVFSTPSTHHGHHGRYADDPATHYKGNYGNMLFLWDILFGTAKITRSYPESYGIENLPDASLGQQLLWPIFPAKKDAHHDDAAETPDGSKAAGVTFSAR